MKYVDPERFDFLVRLSPDGYFLAEISGKQLRGTAIPSAALHLDYLGADRISNNLRHCGWPQVFVTDITGVPVTADMLRQTPAPAKPSLPTTLAELDKIPSAELKRRRKTEPQFAARVADLYASAQR
jgi:hypothetical protein